MRYEISVSDRRTYLHTQVNESVTAELLEIFITEAAEKAKTYEIDNFLFDLSCTREPSNLFSHYDMVYNQSKKLGFKPGSKHALVVSHENMGGYRFVETILLNAGYHSKMFTDESSAIEWLEK